MPNSSYPLSVGRYKSDRPTEVDSRPLPEGLAAAAAAAWRADVVADAYAVVKLRASVDGTDTEYSVAQMIEARVTKWSLFGDEFSNLLRERDC